MDHVIHRSDLIGLSPDFAKIHISSRCNEIIEKENCDHVHVHENQSNLTLEIIPIFKPDCCPNLKRQDRGTPHG